MARANPAVPRNNDEFDAEPPEYPPTLQPEDENGNGAQETVRRRRSPLERSIANLLRSREDASQDELARDVEAKFKELATIREDAGRQQVVVERTTAYNDVLKRKIKTLKRSLLELALNVDED